MVPRAIRNSVRFPVRFMRLRKRIAVPTNPMSAARIMTAGTGTSCGSARAAMASRITAPMAKGSASTRSVSTPAAGAPRMSGEIERSPSVFTVGPFTPS
jgi:hypothetical protein